MPVLIALVLSFAFLGFVFMAFVTIVAAWPLFLVLGLWCMYRDHKNRSKVRL